MNKKKYLIRFILYCFNQYCREIRFIPIRNFPHVFLLGTLLQNNTFYQKELCYEAEITGLHDNLIFMVCTSIVHKYWLKYVPKWILSKNIVIDQACLFDHMWNTSCVSLTYFTFWLQLVKQVFIQNFFVVLWVLSIGKFS